MFPGGIQGYILFLLLYHNFDLLIPAPFKGISYWKASKWRILVKLVETSPVEHSIILFIGILGFLQSSYKWGLHHPLKQPSKVLNTAQLLYRFTILTDPTRLWHQSRPRHPFVSLVEERDQVPKVSQTFQKTKKTKKLNFQKS